MVRWESGLPAVELVVLRRHHDGPDADRPVALVLNRDLGLAVGSQPEVLRHAPPAPSHRREALGHPVRQDNRQRHELRGLVGGIPEHHPLITGPLLIGVLGIHALGDVGRLPVDRGEHRTGAMIEPHARVNISDPLDRGAHDIGNVDVGRGGDFPGHHGHSGGDDRLARDPGDRITGQDGVEHRIGDLVGYLVRVTFGHRLGRKYMAHGQRLRR